MLVLYLEHCSDILCDLLGGVVATITLDYVSVLIKQKLLKIPTHDHETSQSHKEKITNNSPCNIRAAHRRPQSDGCVVKGSARKNESMHIIHAITLAVTGRIHRNRNRVTHPAEERMSASAVHIDLAENGELGLKAIARTDIFESVEELCLTLVGLVTKLVAWKAQNSHLVSESLHNGVLLNVTKIYRKSAILPLQ